MRARFANRRRGSGITEKALLFVNKKTQKTLYVWSWAMAPQAPGAKRSESFLRSFFSKKRPLKSAVCRRGGTAYKITNLSRNNESLEPLYLP